MKTGVVPFPDSTQIAWTNGVGRSGTGSAGTINSGAILRLAAGGLFAVATVTLAANATGIIETRGTVRVPKATGTAFTVGQRLGYDFGNDRVTTSLADGCVGTVRKAAASADTTVEIELNESGPRVFNKVLTPSAGEGSAHQMDVDVGFTATGAVVLGHIYNSSGVQRTMGTVTFNPGSAAPTTVRIAEGALAATDKVHLLVVEQTGS